LFKKMTESGNEKTINSKIGFSPIDQIHPTYVEKVFEFAYAMSFGNEGKHRDHRTGGDHSRKNDEIFANAFQGKLSEYAIFQELNKYYKLAEPDLSVHGEGVWDDSDFIIEGNKISIKSTKFFGNLLLLEQEDWNSHGQYIPNLNSSDGNYAITILVRLKPFCEDVPEVKSILGSVQIDKGILKNAILKQNWKYDIPGFITQDDLVRIISAKHIIYKKDLLNGKTPMDANNYYVQAGDLKKLNRLKKVKET